jgi:hypothetical protein
MSIDVPAKLISGVAAAYQKRAMLSYRQVVQETSAQGDVRHLQVSRSFGRHEAPLSLELEVAHREKPQPDATAPGTLLEADTTLEIADLSECPEFEGTGSL